MHLPRLLTALAITAFSLGAMAQDLTPTVEWSFETKGKIYASPILVDLEEDGNVEVIVAASHDRRILCLDGQGKLRWDFGFEDEDADGFQATPSAVDCDGDGKLEVFWLSRGGTAGCLDASGRLRWRTILGDTIDYTGPVLADINADGRVEMVFGSESGTLYCLDDTGGVRWRYRGNGPVRGVPAVARVGDAAGMRVYAAFGGGESACLDHDGSLVWSFNEAMPRGERRSGFAVGDLDGDGRPEAISATEDFRVIVRDAETGEERWRWKGQGGIDQTCSFALADFEGDGTLDIVTGDSSGHVYRLRDGKALWATPLGGGRGGIVQGPSVGDVDGDGLLDILVCSRSKRLVCLSQDGEIKWDFETAAQPLTTPALGDVDGDGQVEIVITGKDRFVHCLSMGGAYDPAKLPWPMLGHDAQLSGNADGAPFSAEACTACPQQAPRLLLELPETLAMGSNRVGFSVRNAGDRRRRIEARVEVERPGGTVVSHRAVLPFDPCASTEHSFELPVYAPGAYRFKGWMADLGTAEILDTAAARVDVQPFSAERTEAEQLSRHARAALDRIHDPETAARALAALEEHDLDALLEELSTGLSTGPEAVERAHAALDAYRRCAARIFAAAAMPAAEQPFAVLPFSSLCKVFRDEPLLTAPTQASPAKIEVARNEYESLQAVVVPLWADLDGLSVEVQPLEHSGGGPALGAEQISVRPVGYVEIGAPEYNWYVEKVGWYPDVLLPNEALDVSAEQDAQPFFITVHAPEDQPAGLYRGDIVLKDASGHERALPLEVEVWDFALPEETTLKTSFWMSEGDIARFYGHEGRPPFEVRQRFYDLHLEARMSPVMSFPLGGGGVEEDFAYLMDKGQNCFFVRIPDVFDEESRAAYAEKLLATRGLLEEKGWADQALLYSHDEVAVMARHLIPQVADTNRWVRSILPEWPILQTSAPEPQLVGAVDVWCPLIDHFDPGLLAQRKAAGDRLWFYTVWGRPGIMIEFPATDYRLMFWQCWKYGAEGFLYWGTTHWGYNVQGEERWPERPWITYNSQPGHNGCGYMVYPGPDETPLASIRMDIARDGIEDFEYLHLLKELFAQHQEGMVPELRRHLTRLLSVPAEVVTDHKVFTEDPELLLRTRREIAQAILSLQRK